MRITDLGAVSAIERNAQASPWPRLSFEESLAKQYRTRVVVDTERDEKIIAYHVVSSVLDELHILNLVVRQEYQGQGIAHMLMDDIFSLVNGLSDVKKVFLEVRESNQKARKLYQQWQFKQIAIRKDYYRNGPERGREDALVFVRLI
ncbi:MAG: ribosomal protein S18-alanine N-acetyltransferase [Acidiferrobacterales bacterium]|nr:ribosomal protein S18-alanine N-acetyltransferase [Acidiferrobacterales bacterium]